MGGNRSLTVTLETVTPLFLGGADPRGAPELRPPSVRGALRYWLRVALGGAIGDNNLEALRDLESTVFGSTEYGSPVCIRLKQLDGGLESSDEKILPHKKGPRTGSRKAFKTGQEFEFRAWMPRQADKEVWGAATAALRLAITFGGVGLRSRRGFGTLKVVRSSNPALVPVSPTSLSGWQQHVVQTAEGAVAAARQLAQSRNVPVLPQPLPGPTGFPCANKACLIMVHDLRAISSGEATANFMRVVPRDMAFGGIQPRQASPLWVRPIQTENGYGLLLLVLASCLKTGTNYRSIRDFLDQYFPGVSLEAKGWNI
jgi:CRISPR-associated protein Cmr1